MLRGVTTVIFYADAPQEAADWYADLLGIQPYFVRPEEGPPAYIEFRLGDYLHELGILDTRYAPNEVSTNATGATVYWHVDDIEAAYERVLGMGAKTVEPIVERGPGFVTASVLDPFGNVLGLMYNEHYLGVLEGVVPE